MLSQYGEAGEHSHCARLAVLIWNSRDGAIPVCEQCEAIVREMGATDFIEFGFENRTQEVH